MDEKMDALTTLLDRLTQAMQRIAALENQKTKILLKGSVEELGALLNAQQPLIMQSYNLERRRAELQRTMGMEKDDMVRIAENPAPGEETRLADAFCRLRSAVVELKRLGGLNGRILHARIDTKKNLLRIFGVCEELPTYSK